METREILELVRSGAMSVEEAEERFRRLPFEDMGYAKLDRHRKTRSGFPEVIFCSGKPDEFLVNIYERMAEADGQAFGTRATARQYELVKKVIPDKGPQRACGRGHWRHSGYPCGGGSGADGGIFWHKCRAHL